MESNGSSCNPSALHSGEARLEPCPKHWFFVDFLSSSRRISGQRLETGNNHFSQTISNSSKAIMS